MTARGDIWDGVLVCVSQLLGRRGHSTVLSRLHCRGRFAAFGCLLLDTPVFGIVLLCFYPFGRLSPACVGIYIDSSHVKGEANAMLRVHMPVFLPLLFAFAFASTCLFFSAYTLQDA